MQQASVRRLFSSGGTDVKLSTLDKIASSLGATIEIKLVDSDVPARLKKMLVERVRNRGLAERVAASNPDLEASRKRRR